MATTSPIRIKTVSEFHKFRNLPEPQHPLISIINMEDIDNEYIKDYSLVANYYSIAVKRGLNGKFKYGQQEYDFNAGLMFFIAPNQVFSVEHNRNKTSKQSGWLMLVHPDFIWNTSLAKNINQYEFFNYKVNEALFLSGKEEKTVNGIIENIREEYHSTIDKFSKQIIVSHIEALLNYSERFYNRQFITREKANHQLINQLEIVLSNYFNSEDLISKGLPTVQYVAETLNVSPSYLGNMLRVLTGRNTQQHIHEKLIEKAKEKLSTTDLTVSEIAFEMGFEHPQSFSKLFKTKTDLSPLEFRQSFS